LGLDVIYVQAKKGSTILSVKKGLIEKHPLTS